MDSDERKRKKERVPNERTLFQCIGDLLFYMKYEVYHQIYLYYYFQYTKYDEELAAYEADKKYYERQGDSFMASIFLTDMKRTQKLVEYYEEKTNKWENYKY